MISSKRAVAENRSGDKLLSEQQSAPIQRRMVSSEKERMPASSQPCAFVENGEREDEMLWDAGKSEGALPRLALLQDVLPPELILSSTQTIRTAELAQPSSDVPDRKPQ